MSTRAPRALIKRVVLRNYRSIESCDVTLGPLTYLVGPNGSGKSNFLDALQFVSDALRGPIDEAVHGELFWRGDGPLAVLSIRLELEIDGKSGSFALKLRDGLGGAVSILEESCELDGHSYRVHDGVLAKGPGVYPPLSVDRVYLTNAGGLPEFRPVFDLLSHARVYNIDPDAIRPPFDRKSNTLLARDGANLAAIVPTLTEAVHERVRDYLRAIVPGISDFAAKRVTHATELEFTQGPHDWQFRASEMSDGTLRTLAILVALLHASPDGVSIVGIEEPENAIHPAEMAVLRDAIFEAADRVQVIVTTHSADLLDDRDFPIDALRAVSARSGKTVIGPLADAPRSVVLEHMYTAGELLRIGQLDPGSPEDRPPTAPLANHPAL